MTTAVVVMGVSGCGKSTLGQALATALGWHFVEGDRHHPATNIAKMAAGIALEDEDREPFLRNVAQAIARRRGQGVVVACSALKRQYRDLIRASAGEVLFLLPVLPDEQLRRRIEQRSGHFMPASLLESQLAALEPPEQDEDAALIDGSATLDAQVAVALAALQTRRPPEMRKQFGTAARRQKAD